VLATTLVPVVGTTGVVGLRLGTAAVVLLAVWRPRLRSQRDHALLLVGVGLVLCVHHLSFYAAISRIPLGTATTIEFLGPFTVAVALSRGAAQLAWAVLALAGVVLVAGPSASSDAWGLAAAGLAAAAWGGYVLLARVLARTVPVGPGLASAVTVGALVAVPLGLLANGAGLLRPHVLLTGGCVALLSTVAPYLLQLHALRRLDPRAFGLLTSLEPAVAALLGLVLLAQRLTPGQWTGVAAVVAASASATLERDHRVRRRRLR
jgi:inner membrane transporter RhtA